MSTFNSKWLLFMVFFSVLFAIVATVPTIYNTYWQPFSITLPNNYKGVIRIQYDQRSGSFFYQKNVTINHIGFAKLHSESPYRQFCETVAFFESGKPVAFKPADSRRSKKDSKQYLFNIGDVAGEELWYFVGTSDEFENATPMIEKKILEKMNMKRLGKEKFSKKRRR